MGYSGPLPVE